MPKTKHIWKFAIFYYEIVLSSWSSYMPPFGGD
jgi:hypothetical protein